MSDTSTTSADAPVVLDLRGLNCPLPALRTRKALRRMNPGARLLVECTDPMSAIDVPHCVFECGDTLESHTVEGDVLRFLIRRES